MQDFEVAADYLANPTKYHGARRARLLEAVNTIPQLKIGDELCVEFFDARLNRYRGGMMPIYRVHDPRLDYSPLLFACALTDFRSEARS